MARGRGGWGKSVFFCPSDVLSPYFSEYTNDKPLKTNFRYIDHHPTPHAHPFPHKQTKIKSHFGAVSPQRPAYSSVAYSIWGL